MAIPPKDEWVDEQPGDWVDEIPTAPKPSTAEVLKKGPPSYLEAAVSGFKQEPLPPGSGLGRGVVHGIAEEALPTIGAVAGAPAGLVGIGAGAAAGRAAQKGIAAGVRAIAGEPASPETPLQIGGEVMGTGLLQAAGEATAAKAMKWLGAAPAKLGGAARRQAEADMNALLKPANVQQMYGKNVGRAVLDENISANSLPELVEGIGTKLGEVGAEYAPILAKTEVAARRFSIEGFTEPIDAAIAKLQKTPHGMETTIKRLEDLKLNITGGTRGPKGEMIIPNNFRSVSPSEALEIKRTIGDLTSFKGLTAEDAAADAAGKKVYGKLDAALDRYVPEMKRLNERYANLLGAHISAKRQMMGAVRSAVSTTDALAGAGLPIAREMIKSPGMQIRVAKGLESAVAPALETVGGYAAPAAGAVTAAQIPQTMARKTAEEIDPLGLFQ